MKAPRKAKPKAKRAATAGDSARAPKAKRKRAPAPAPARVRPPPPDVSHKPDEKQRGEVRTLASVGVPQDEIAVFLGIDPKTLRKHYADELRTALTKANAAIAGNLYKKAMGGDTASMIFWLKVRANWSERQQVAVTNHNALPSSVHEFV